jgi:hypothetical protein
MPATEYYSAVAILLNSNPLPKCLNRTPVARLKHATANQLIKRYSNLKLKPESISQELESLTNADNKGFYRPYQLLLLFALILAIIPFFFWTQSIGLRIFKLNILLIDKIYLRTLSAVLFLQWTIYVFFYKRFSRALSVIQITVSLVAVAIIVLEGKWILEPEQSNSPRYTIMRVLINNDVRELKLFTFEGITFVTAQLLFIANLSIAFIRQTKVPHTTQHC